MSKCRKAKNPCKICLREVTRKTGLQCEGACHSWVHYECLNYTPGKIQDIRNKVIRVSCPCPDCKSTLPKEHRANEHFSCTNPKCPANLPPRCKNKECPFGASLDEKAGCSLSQCGNSCKQNASEMVICKENPRSPGVSAASGYGTPCQTQDAGTDYISCPSRSSRDIPGDFCQTSSGMEDMCAAVGHLTTQITDLMQKMKAVLESSRGRNKTQLQPCRCPGNSTRK